MKIIFILFFLNYREYFLIKTNLFLDKTSPAPNNGALTFLWNSEFLRFLKQISKNESIVQDEGEKDSLIQLDPIIVTQQIQVTTNKRASSISIGSEFPALCNREGDCQESCRIYYQDQKFLTGFVFSSRSSKNIKFSLFFL